MKSFTDAVMPTFDNIISGLSKLCASDSSPPISATSAPSAIKSNALPFKYIIFTAQGIQTCSIIPPFAQHSDAINLAAKTAISAGFAWIERETPRSIFRVHVEGESTSLKLKSRPEDAEIIHETLIMNGL